MGSVQKRNMSQSSLATLSIILVECVAFAISISFSSLFQVVDLFGFSYTGFTEGRQFWTPLTSLFVHVSIYHLLINMFLLYVFGTALETQKGSKFLLATFFLGGILSLFIGIPLYSPATKIVGSSIAVSAVIGAVMVAIPNRPSPIFLFRAPLGLVALIYFIFNVFFAIYGQSALGVAYPSHIIGFLIGVGIVLVTSLAMKTNGMKSKQQHLRSALN